MSQRKIPVASLTRRSWLTLAGAALTGCGGGGSSSLAGSPGTGGTGAPLFTQGSISGFGSVIINGIKFDDLQAAVQVDGASATSADLRLGMVAGVQGARGADLTLGQASNIEVWSIAQGLVTGVGTSDFEVAGMSIQTDTSTSFEGVSSNAVLPLGASVIVWGLLANPDGIHWSATRVAVIAASSVTVSTGVFAVSKNERTLNSLKLTGTASAALSDGQMVRVAGALSSDQETLTVASAKVLSSGFDTQLQDELEIEGVVTSVASAGSFRMGNTNVNAIQAVFDPVGAQITVGARLEVVGAWSSGVLMASRIRVESQKTSSIEISARIDQYTSLDNFVMRGQRCDASKATFSGGSAADLKAGVKVKVVGSKAGDVLLVTAVSFSN